VLVSPAHAHRGWCLVQAPRWPMGDGGWGVSRASARGAVWGSQVGTIWTTGMTSANNEVGWATYDIRHTAHGVGVGNPGVLPAVLCVVCVCVFTRSVLPLIRFPLPYWVPPCVVRVFCCPASRTEAKAMTRIEAATSPCSRLCCAVELAQRLCMCLYIPICQCLPTSLSPIHKEANPCAPHSTYIGRCWYFPQKLPESPEPEITTC
jgi:hypothetical protein